MGLIVVECDAIACGRVATGVGALFEFFRWGPVGPSELDPRVFVGDPDARGDGLSCRGACVEATESCGVCDFTGEIFCPCRSGTMAEETLRGKVSDRVTDMRV